MIRWFGPQLWVVKHLANDWLAATWFILWANLLVAFASFVILIATLVYQDTTQIFIWVSGYAICLVEMFFDVVLLLVFGVTPSFRRQCLFF